MRPAASPARANLRPRPFVAPTASHTARPPRPRAQVMPNLLSRRRFQPPATLRMVLPGFRDAPEAGDPMAIVFCKARGGCLPVVSTVCVVAVAL